MDPWEEISNILNGYITDGQNTGDLEAPVCCAHMFFNFQIFQGVISAVLTFW